MVSPRASPASAASTLSWPGQPAFLPGSRLTVSESASRHRPPNIRTWASGSLNVPRLVYCSGRLSASTAAAAGAQPGPASRPARPPNESTAQPPITGVTRRAPPMPCSQNPAASTSGAPVMNCGTMPVPRG